MEFDKSRVYTAVNADELKAGSLIVVGLNLKELELKVKNGRYTQALVDVAGKDCTDRFGVDDYGCLDSLSYYPLAQLISPPKEPEYKSFSNAEKAMEAIKKHGGWVKDKKDNVQLLVVGCNDDNGVFLGNGYSCSYTNLFFDYVFADDGSPCGELVEE